MPIRLLQEVPALVIVVAPSRLLISALSLTVQPSGVTIMNPMKKPTNAATRGSERRSTIATISQDASEQRRDRGAQIEKSLGPRSISVQLREQIDAEIEGDDCEGEISGRQEVRKRGACRQLHDRTFNEVQPRFHPRGDLAAQLGVA